MVACGDEPSGPLAINSVTFMRDDGNGRPGDTVTDFKTTDRHLHAKATLNRSASDVPVKVVWIAVDTSAGKNITIAQVDLGKLNGGNTIDTDVSLPRDFPAGKYQVDFYLSDKVAKSATFNIN
jgi:hypothetical protein